MRSTNEGLRCEHEARSGLDMREADEMRRKVCKVKPTQRRRLGDEGKGMAHLQHLRIFQVAFNPFLGRRIYF
ncbi:hypothetical protein E2C01_038296 [Portunus trituberculatus]|uniref:Uncharacterized protein n=1 Tax=Portunus trituberculatus TaxID=210409 RepID=A0A5B7FH84_PORTR|nr:hypothetical protein [Portunus trituberculatus]